jgi:hypothetical protein
VAVSIRDELVTELLEEIIALIGGGNGDRRSGGEAGEILVDKSFAASVPSSCGLAGVVGVGEVGELVHSM